MLVIRGGLEGPKQALPTPPRGLPNYIALGAFERAVKNAICSGFLAQKRLPSRCRMQPGFGGLIDCPKRPANQHDSATAELHFGHTTSQANAPCRCGARASVGETAFCT